VVDGIPRVKPATGLWIQNSGQNLDYTIPINGLDLGDPAKNVKAMANSYNVPSELIERAFTIAMNNASPLPVIPVTLTAAGPYQQTLTDKGTSFTYRAIAAKPAEFDKIWDEGIADWLASGAQVILDERRAKYIEP
jgi:putative aldouronate transport system substrate-binding protein